MERYYALIVAMLCAVVSAALVVWSAMLLIPFVLALALSAIGIWDMLQTKHSLRRNYPILANIRFMLEKIRPEIRQYFLESDLDGTPFNRSISAHPRAQKSWEAWSAAISASRSATRNAASPIPPRSITSRR